MQNGIAFNVFFFFFNKGLNVYAYGTTFTYLKIAFAEVD